MRKELALSLNEKTAEVSRVFSNPKREYNTNGETFDHQKTIVLSEKTALASYLKESGKLALVFFYYVKDRWFYFFPTESHVVGMSKVSDYLHKVEQSNFKQNEVANYGSKG